MRNGLAGIDHVVVGVRRLESARASWTRLGFTLTPRGRHVGEETANYCIMFADDYVELLGTVDRDEASGRGGGGVQAQRLEAFLARREGAMAVAFAPEEAAATAGAAADTAVALAALGVHPGEPRTLGRRLELSAAAPAATDSVTLRFSLLTLAPEDTPALDCFICGHLTPELARHRPEWLIHPNGAVGLRGIYLVVAETAPLLPAYDRLFGMHEVTTTDAVASVRIGASHRMLLAPPDDFATMHPGIVLPRDFPVPGIAALEFAIARRADTADYLARRRIAHDELPDGRLAVPAHEANGTILFLTED